jgi:hypothetical protein
MRTFLRVTLVAVALLSSVPARATCERYQCRIYPDTADCLIRMGPNSTNFPQATSCEGDCNCMPDTSGTGSLNCDCFCRYNYCYDI